MNPMKINRASPIERMIPTSFDGTKSKAKSIPDTTSTEIKKYKAVSLRSFTAWIIAQKSRKSIKIVVQTEEGLFCILAAFFPSFPLFSPPPYSLRFISSAVPVVAGAPRGQWACIKAGMGNLSKIQRFFRGVHSSKLRLRNCLFRHCKRPWYHASFRSCAPSMRELTGLILSAKKNKGSIGAEPLFKVLLAAGIRRLCAWEVPVGAYARA